MLDGDDGSAQDGVVVVADEMDRPGEVTLPDWLEYWYEGTGLAGSALGRNDMVWWVLGYTTPSWDLTRCERFCNVRDCVAHWTETVE